MVLLVDLLRFLVVEDRFDPFLTVSWVELFALVTRVEFLLLDGRGVGVTFTLKDGTFPSLINGWFRLVVLFLLKDKPELFLFVF